MDQKLRELLKTSEEVAKTYKEPRKLLFLGPLVKNIKPLKHFRVTFRELQAPNSDGVFTIWEIAVHAHHSEVPRDIERLKKFRRDISEHVATVLRIPQGQIPGAKSTQTKLWAITVQLRQDGFFKLIGDPYNYTGHHFGLLPYLMLGVCLDELLLCLTQGVHEKHEAAARIA